MSKDLTIFDGGTMQAPAHIVDAFGDESNIEPRQSVPSLSYEGKVWTVAIDGEKHRLTRTNEDGDEEPLSTMRVVILDAAKNRGRTYYEGAYDPANASAPICWSDDGKYPHSSIEEPQCSNCTECPMAAKGSKITEQGKAVAACSQHRMLAVVPAGRMDGTPLRLKIAITSDWDKQSPDEQQKGWFAFSNFKDFLISKGIQHTAQIVTKIKFDQSVAYPKLFFSPDRWLEAAEVEKVKPMIGSDEVSSLLGGSYTPAGVDGKPIEKAPAEEPKQETKQETKKEAKKAPAKETEKAPAKETKKAPAEGQESEPEKEAQPAETSKVNADVPDDVASLLSEWGD